MLISIRLSPDCLSVCVRMFKKFQTKNLKLIQAADLVPKNSTALLAKHSALEEAENMAPLLPLQCRSTPPPAPVESYSPSADSYRHRAKSAKKHRSKAAKAKARSAKARVVVKMRHVKVQWVMKNCAVVGESIGHLFSYWVIRIHPSSLISCRFKLITLTSPKMPVNTFLLSFYWLFSHLFVP